MNNNNNTEEVLKELKLKIENQQMSEEEREILEAKIVSAQEEITKLNNNNEEEEEEMPDAEEEEKEKATVSTIPPAPPLTTTVRVITTDGKTFFDLEPEIGSQSQLLCATFETDERIIITASAIPETNVAVDVATMKKVLEYCEHHKEDAAAAAAKKKKEEKEKKEEEEPAGAKKEYNKSNKIEDEWDRKFIDMEDSDDVGQILLAADVLEIAPLLELGYKFAAQLYELSAEKMCEYLRIEVPKEEDLPK